MITADALDTLLKEEKAMNKETLRNLQVAIWFCATGYYKDLAYGGVTSLNFAEKYLKQEGYSEEEILLIQQYIKAANSKVVPKTKEEMLVQDAVYAFLADKNFNEQQTLWRAENDAIKESELTNKEWFTYLKGIIDSKLFYTSYAIKNWAYKVQGNYLKLISKETKQQQKQVEKGRDTVFRITLRNHISLSDNADRKAHILLSVNAIIISIIFSRIFPKLDNPSNTFLIVPTLVFVIFTVISIILSVIATRPRITKGKFSYEDITHKKTNILFFGNFHRVRLEEYERAMDMLLSNNEYIYNSLTKDLYYLGKVVAKKYKILQYTYAVFMAGIVVSTILYIVFFNIYN
ncbi:hypothetical protein NBRC110019_14400 [Neptunitalea chrysea]|uniref:Pycsar effector protein domain-containing protein n=2 Tax=Neptunitalea chrysea TaxID=1647581 RepID=A0A9W6ETR1_9FLAO|nr:hypothetical protein NBRC110019_14400 [Neptunitalea chrysea]